MYVLVAVAAALAFACSGVLKHRSARAIAAEPPGGRGRLRTLLVRTVRHRTWLLAIGVDAAAIALQISALHAGPLSVVQPLLAVSLVFAMVISARGRLPARVWLWCAALVVSVAAVSRLVVGTSRATAGFIPAAVFAAVVAGVALACLAIAMRTGASPARAIALGGGVGVLYAANAALLKSIAASAATHGLVGVVSAWQLYVVIVGGAIGLLVNQAAFQAGSLQQVLPAMAAADPLTSIVVGTVVFGEPLLGGSAGVLALVLTTVLLGTATVRLATAVTPIATTADDAADDAGESRPQNRYASCAS